MLRRNEYLESEQAGLLKERKGRGKEHVKQRE
jgi:hypothetical protein